ncbi:MAG TPA: hypothetical protein VFP54_12070 [Acidimicrobiales bacterium]|nr:hypothetical protein [Acidimicrobiales bacterium]
MPELAFRAVPNGAFTDAPGWTGLKTSAGTPALAVETGRLKAVTTQLAESVALLETQHRPDVTVIDAEFTFAGRRLRRDRGGVRIGAWGRSVIASHPEFPYGSCVLVVTPTDWSYSVFDPDQGAQVIKKGRFHPRLAADDVTVHRVEVRFDGTTAEITLPDGMIETVVDGRIGTWIRRVAAFELRHGPHRRDSRAAFVSVASLPD